MDCILDIATDSAIRVVTPPHIAAQPCRTTASMGIGDGSSDVHYGAVRSIGCHGSTHLFDGGLRCAFEMEGDQACR
jgi:hypothetical protein